jgi:D-arginine dehydrogenase
VAALSQWSKLFDLTIVGGGIVGTVAAYLAHRHRPDWRVLVLERHLVGQGATRASAGFDLPFEGTDRKRRMAAQSREIFQELRETVPGVRIFEHPLFLVGTRDNVERMRSGLSPGLVDAAPNETESLRKIFSGLRWDEDQVLLRAGRGLWSDASGVTDALMAQLAKCADLTLWEGTEVRRIDRLGDEVRLSLGDGREILSRRALVATGPWLLAGPGGEAASDAGARLKKVVALHVAVQPPPGAPIVLFLDDDAFLLPTIERGRWLFSFTSQEWDCTPDASRLRISAEDRESALGVLQRYVPGWVDRCNSGQLFCDAYTPDRDPLVTTLPDSPSVVIAGGASGSGYRLAPGIAHEALGLLGAFRPSSNLHS